MKDIYTVYKPVDTAETLDKIKAFLQVYKVKRITDYAYLAINFAIMLFCGILLLVCLANISSVKEVENGTARFIILALTGLIFIFLLVYENYKKELRVFKLEKFLIIDLSVEYCHKPIVGDYSIPQELVKSATGVVKLGDCFITINKEAYILAGRYCLLDTSLGVALYEKTEEKRYAKRGEEHDNTDV